MAEEAIQETQQDTGLLDGLASEVVEDNAPKANEELSHIDKSNEPATIAEDGQEPEDVEYERPDFIPEKFWGDDGPELEKLAKSYTELETQFKQGKHKAPKEYNTEVFSEKNLSMDDPTVKTFHDWSLKHGITQGAYDELAQGVLSITEANTEDTKFAREQELKKLGPNADQLVAGIRDFAKGLVRKGVLGADDMNEFQAMAGTADGIKVLNKIRRYYGEQTIPTQSVDIEGQPSGDELNSMIADPRYLTDPAYRSRVEKAFEKAYGGSVKVPVG